MIEVTTFLLLQCSCICTMLCKTSISQRTRQQNGKATAASLTLVLSVQLITAAFIPNIHLPLFLSNYADCLGLGLSNRSLKSLRGFQAGQGRGGKVLAQLQAGPTPPAHLPVPPWTTPWPQTGTQGRAGSCRERPGTAPTAQVPTRELLRWKELNFLSNYPPISRMRISGD